MQALQYVLMFASTAIQVDQQQRAGEIVEAQSEIDANAERDSAVQDEIQRKKKLAQALSSQLAESASMGIAFEGSPARMAQLDIDEANRDLEITTATSAQRQRALRLQGRNARVVANAASATTLIDAGARSIDL